MSTIRTLPPPSSPSSTGSKQRFQEGEAEGQGQAQYAGPKYTLEEHLEIEQQLKADPGMYRWTHCFVSGNIVIVLFVSFTLLVYTFLLGRHLRPHPLYPLISFGVYGSGFLAYSMLYLLFKVDPGKVSDIPYLSPHPCLSVAGE